MKTLEQYFRDNNQTIDHSIRVQVRDNLVTFYIHPQGVNGDTLDFYVEDNSLIPITSGGYVYNKKELNIEKALKLACTELAKIPDSPFEQKNCPFTVYRNCVIPSEKHPVKCDDVRVECWGTYFLINS